MDKQKFQIGNYKKLIRVVAVFAVAIYAIITIISQQVTMNGQKEKNRQLIATQTELSTEVEELERTLKYIDSDSYAEQAARKFGWVKDGEIIFKISPDAEQKETE